MVELRKPNQQKQNPTDKADEPKLDKIDFVAVAVFVLIVMVIPWEVLQGYNFVDRERYLNYFSFSVNILEYREFNNVIDYIKYEALWHYIVSLLVNDFLIPIEYVFASISIFCLSVFSIFVVRRLGYYYLIFLFSPLVITLVFDQLRMALAYSLLVSAYLIRKPIFVAMLILPAIFIHTSMIVFLCIYIAIRILIHYENKNTFGPFVTYLSCVLLGISISIAIGPLREVILGAIGDRRADYGAASSSVLYTMYWVALLGLASIQNSSFYKSEVNKYSIIILSLVTMNLFTGGYTLRFLAIGLPFILVTMSSMSSDIKKISLFFYALYLIFQWLYWVRVGLVA